jgi:hypothetical protein
MKNDREFLDGIYRKAQLIEETERARQTEQKNNWLYRLGNRLADCRLLAGMTTGFAVLAVLTIAFVANPPTAVTTPVTTSVPTAGISAASRIFEMAEAQTDTRFPTRGVPGETVVTGTIASVSAENETVTVTLKVGQCLRGTSGNKLTFTYRQNESTSFSVNEQVLVALSGTSDRSLELYYPPYGKYSYVETADNQDVYLSYDGIYTTTEDIQ